MSYGIKIVNNNGIELIDGDFDSYRIMAKGSVQTIKEPIIWPSLSTRSGGAITISDYDLVFARLGIAHSITPAFYTSPTMSFTSTEMGIVADAVDAEGQVPDITQEWQTDVEYLVCRPSRLTTPPASTGYGMEVFREDGTLSFSTNADYASMTTNKVMTSGELSHSLYSSFLEVPLPVIPYYSSYWICLNQLAPWAYYVGNVGSVQVDVTEQLACHLKYTGTIGSPCNLVISARMVPSSVHDGSHPLHFDFSNSRNLIVAQYP